MSQFSENISESTKKTGQTAKKVVKTAAKKAADTAFGPIGGVAVEAADKLLKPLLICVLCFLIIIPSILLTGIGTTLDIFLHTDEEEHPINDYEMEVELGVDEIKDEDRKYAYLIVEQMQQERQFIDKYIKKEAEKKGIDFNDAVIIDNTFIPNLSEGSSGKGSAEAAADWAIQTAADNKYIRKSYPNVSGIPAGRRSGVGTHCPICHPELCKPNGLEDFGWNCMGFVQAAYIHGGHLTEVAHANPGLNGQMIDDAAGNRLYRTMDLSTWKRHNGDDWELFKVGNDFTWDDMEKGDCLIFYQGSTYFHTAIYVGDGKLADSNGYRRDTADEVAVRSVNGYKRYNTLVVRYTGDGQVSEEKGASSDELLSACKVQAEWMKDYTYDWEKNPTVQKSKKRGTCVTYVACVLQRIGILKSGEFVWINKSKKVTGANSKMTVTYPGGTLKSNKSKLQKGDIVIGGNGNINAAEGSHIFVLTGKWDGNRPYIYDNHSAERVKKGKSPEHSYNANFPVIALIRLTGSGSTVTSGRKSQSIKDVIDGACAWAEAIAADDSFHYGHGDDAHHNGCYFCKTQPSKKKRGNIVDWEKTYCCNPFVTAAYAHGGGSPSALKLCQKGKSWWITTFPKSNQWKSLGKPSLSKLQKGDVLTKGSGDKGHVALYIGDGKIAHAAGGDDNKKGSKEWNASIRVNKATAGTISGYSHAYRYIGSYGGTMSIPSGGSIDSGVQFSPCDSETILETITSSTGSRMKLKNFRGTTCAQSFASVGDKYVVAFTTASDPPTNIGLYSSTGNLLDGFNCNAAGHANGACANENGDVYIGGNLGSNRNLVQCISVTGNNISKSGTKLMPANSSSLAYDKDTQNYILRAGSTMRVFDSSLSSQTKLIHDNKFGHGAYYQDVGAGGGYIFSIHNHVKGGENSGYSYIDVHNEESGEYCGSFKVNYGELESVDIVDGEMVLLVHIKGSSTNYIQKTGIRVDGSSGDGTIDEITRDIAAALASFSVYESELLPTNYDSLEKESDSGIKSLWLRIKEKFRRDPDIQATLKALLNQNDLYEWIGLGYKEGLLKLTFSNVITKNGKEIAIIEIDHNDGDGLARRFHMDPNATYSTEGGREKAESATRSEGEDYPIGETTIAEAIETNTDKHMALLYDNINGETFSKSPLVLPIKTMFTKLKLSKAFSEDLTGIECKPAEGTKVYSCERGGVDRIVYDDEKLGNYVVISGYYNIIYSHLKTINVKKGDFVNRNVKIGTSTGKFRLEVYDSDTAVDPEPLFVNKIVMGKDYNGFQMGGGDAETGTVDGRRTQFPGYTGKYFTPNSDNNPFDINWGGGGGNCTWYAWGRFMEYHGRTDLKRPWGGHNGDAVDFQYAYQNGYEVGDKPKPGSIAVWGYGSKTGHPGHVAFVEAVNSNLDIETSESGWSGGKFWTTTRKKSAGYCNGLRSDAVFVCFVYPKKAAQPSVKTESGKKGTYQEYAYSLFPKYGWGESEFEPLKKLWNRESGWNPKAKNSSSGAYGIPQSLPADKMKSEGDDYLTNYKTQIKWGLKYIKNRYGSPSKAWAHSEKEGWY